jgi:hypothetical protein
VRVAARAATAMGEMARNESEVLEQALGARLVDLSLQRLSAIVDAVIGLSDAPRAEPAWASPVAAQAAEALLDACGDDLRAGVRTHQAVYAQFDDAIWEVSARRLRKGRHVWRPIARLHLRHTLATVSRTRVAPKPIAASANLILEALRIRKRLETSAPLFANHLGEYDRGPLTDIDTAREALAAVGRLQEPLGDRLDATRLGRLLSAGAFQHDAVLEPARILGTALTAWTADVARLGGGDALAMHGGELMSWASLVEDALPSIEAAVAAVDGHEGTPATLRDLVYDLLVRQRFDELTANTPNTPTTRILGANPGRAS